MIDNTIYQNPLNTRYASREMQENFGDEKRFRLWRKLWIALAESEMELGLPVSQAQIDEMKAHAEDIDYERAEKYEREVGPVGRAQVKTPLPRQHPSFTLGQPAVSWTAIPS